MEKSVLRKKWESHRGNSRNKGVMALSFDEYAKKVADAQIKPEQIGANKGSYQLARYSDSGNYTPESCRFITKEQNLAEEMSNGGFASASAKKRGRTAETHAGLAKMAAKKAGAFVLESPNGEVVSGFNLSAFCRKHGLRQANMVTMKNGKKPTCEGWRLPPPEIVEMEMARLRALTNSGASR